MGLVSSNKSIGNVTEIKCRDTLQVTLGLTAAPDIVDNPVDIVLILDRSGSMSGTPFADLITGVDLFVDMIAAATGGAPDSIDGGSRIGIVSFATTASQDTGLITSVSNLKNSAAALITGGSTNHSDAFSAATTLLSGSSNRKIFVMFTDGVTTAGPDAAPFAEAAKLEGITIYCIGLDGSGGVDVSALNEWASDPDFTHVAVTPNSAELEQLFADLAINISNTGATNIVIEEIINPDFEIIGIPAPSTGIVSQLTQTSFEWRIDQLGVTANESATVTFTIQHIADSTGSKAVDESISYTDAEGNVANFANPTVFVDCREVVNADECSVPVDIVVSGCESFIEFNAGEISLEALGRILQLDVTILNVCPNKRVALAVILYELDQSDIEYSRGMKTYTIPAHDAQECKDVLVQCVRFILPEDLDVSGGTADGICNERNFRARIFAHYIDSDFQCCPPVIS